MVDEWRASTWGEEVRLEYGKALRGYDEFSGKYRVFGSNGPIGWTSQPLVAGPGVILGRKGAYRGVQFSREPFFVIDTAYYVVPNSPLDMRWLYYAIIHYKLGEVDDGSPIPSTTRAAVYMLDVDVPPLEEQRAIAGVLGALDDKIELNRRMNRTLEAMARALFKSWFIDFDPVRAKADGRTPPGMDAATAALFPATFQNSPLGPIPQGWQVGTIGDIGENHRRGIQPDAIAPGTPYIALEHMPRRHIGLSDWSDGLVIESGKYQFVKGEILFGKLRPYFHKVGVAPVDGVCSTDILVISPTIPDWFGFLLCHMFSDQLVAYTSAASTGTKMPRTNWEDVSRFEVVVPPLSIARPFDAQIRRFVKLIDANIQESRTLSVMRDTLLPKLISGELRVPDTELIVGKSL